MQFLKQFNANLVKYYDRKNEHKSQYYYYQINTHASLAKLSNALAISILHILIISIA